MDSAIQGALIGLAGAIVGAAIAAISSHWLEVRRERCRRQEEILYNLRKLVHRLWLETGAAFFVDDFANKIPAEIYQKALSLVHEMYPEFVFHADCARHIIGMELVNKFRDQLLAFYMSKK